MSEFEKREKNKSKTDMVAVKTRSSSSDGLSCVESSGMNPQ